MQIKTCSLYIDNEPFEFEVEGHFFLGENKLLFKHENNIISKTSWQNKGFEVVKTFTKKEFQSLKNSIKSNIVKAIKENNIVFNEENFNLSNYHKIVTTDALHNKVIEITRNLENHDLDFDIKKLTKNFGKALGYELTSWIEELQKTHIQIRINRPNSLDINPPHRDGYLSYWEDIINVWIPIEGCNENSSLPVCSGSHLIPENEILRTESKGAKINGNTYYVPCILKTNNGPIHMIRPNPSIGEAIIFTPFLIHGAAVNKNVDITRVSLELRLPRAKNY